MVDEQSVRYTPEHEWVDVDGDVATVGITTYAATQLGDIVFVDLPAVGDDVVAGQTVGELESTKSVGELFSPVSGTVTEVNEDLSSAPEAVNTDPFGAGWLMRVRFESLPDLLDRGAYDRLTGQD